MILALGGRVWCGTGGVLTTWRTRGLLLVGGTDRSTVTYLSKT